MKYSYFFTFLFVIASCKKDTLEKRESISGKWRMIEYCFSPGDASCPMQKINKNMGQTVDFQSGGKLITKNPFNQIAVFDCGGEWKKVDYTKF